MLNLGTGFLEAGDRAIPVPQPPCPACQEKPYGVCFVRTVCYG